MPQLYTFALQRKDRTANRKGSKVSILSAGSSSGQEPYSLSIAIHDYLQNYVGSGILPNDFVIVATDISSRVLAKAMSGEYSDPEISRGLSDIQKSLYFRKEDNLWVVKDQIRSIVEFRRVNLIEPFTFLGGFDVIFCRNVLIYFDIATRNKIIDQFYDMLSANGTLVLGSTENVYGVSNKFESRYAGNSIYYVKVGGK
jgi:chemotaxis protein methyltransferase CheR